MTTIKFQYGNEVYNYTFNLPCNLNVKLKGSCNPCTELARIDAQIQEIYLRLRDLCVQQRILHRKRNSMHCLISNLPYDIASYIFALCLPPTHGSCNPTHGHEGVKISTPGLTLRLAAVSHSWRTLAVSIQELWARIAIQVDRPDFTSLHYLLQRSGSASLYIRFYGSSSLCNYSGHNIEDTMALIKQNFHRVVYLCIDLSVVGHFNVFEAAFNKDRPDAAPILQEFHVHRGGISATDSPKFHLPISSLPPCPRRVLMSAGSTAVKCHLNWEHVSHLTLRAATFHELSFLLGKANCLVELDLNLLTQDYGITDESLVNLPTIINNSIRCMTLQRSHSYQQRPRYLIFSHTSMTSLENLTLHHLDGFHFTLFSTTFLAFLRRSACRLKSLKIAVFLPSATTMKLLGTVLRETPTIQELSLEIFQGQGSQPELKPFLKHSGLIINDISVDPANSDCSRTPFLPFLSKFSYKGSTYACLSLLLDVITSRSAASHALQIVQSMDYLSIHCTDMMGVEVEEGDLQRILQLRSAGKSVLLFTARRNPETKAISTYDLV